MSGLAESKFSKGDKRRLTKEVFQSARNSLGRIDSTAFEAIDESTRCQVDHDNIVGLLHYPVGNCLLHLDTGDLPDLIVQAFKMLYVHGCENVDTGVEKNLNIFPAFWASRTRNIGVRK